MEGLAAVSARIAQIEALVAPLAIAPRAAPPSGTAATGSFADVLRSVQQSTPGGTPLSALAQLPGAGRLPSTTQLPATAEIGGSTRADVAAFKAAWPNGRISPHDLTPIGGGHRLAGPAAPAFEQMTAAAARDGVSFGVNDSYRSFEEQVRLARSKGLYSQGGLAATPGTSQHGWGLAVDLDLDPKAQAWMRANGPKFGFHEDVPREPWHWTFQGL